MRLLFALPVDAEKPQLPKRDPQSRRHFFLCFPKGQLIPSELLWIGQQVPDVAVGRAQRATEEPRGLARRHYLFPITEPKFAGRGLDFGQEALVTQCTAPVVLFDRPTGQIDPLFDVVSSTKY